jgi:hypothetical protein
MGGEVHILHDMAASELNNKSPTPGGSRDQAFVANSHCSDRELLRTQLKVSWFQSGPEGGDLFLGPGRRPLRGSGSRRHFLRRGLQRRRNGCGTSLRYLALDTYVRKELVAQ